MHNTHIYTHVFVERDLSLYIYIYIYIYIFRIPPTHRQCCALVCVFILSSDCLDIDFVT